MLRPSGVRRICLGAAAIAAFAVASAASAVAHVTLETQQAAAGSGYKAILKVPHGCGGSSTVSIRIRMADGFVDVKPMPKPGWKLETKNAKYSKAYSLRRAKLSEGVTEISWSGGQLPDAHYDEFVFIGAISDDLQSGTTIYFPVVQECEKGVARWIEIPAAGSAHDHASESSQPAPALRIVPRR
jgi:periplasmic copper chaperone A